MQPRSARRAVTKWMLMITSVLTLGITTLPDTAVSAPAATKPLVVDTPVRVQQTLTALDRLAQMGYSVNTSARADRAIRHWQKVNGLVVDGIVGPQTLTSLGLATATATVPAVRLNPPAAAPSPQPVGDVESIIRSIWPDDSEDHAVAIATRESNLQPEVRNSCCWGLFQMNWGAHKSWLIAMGITSPQMLLDPVVNTNAALALFEQAGWGPWKL